MAKKFTAPAPVAYDTGLVLVADLVDAPYNPRPAFQPGELSELLASVQRNGILTPLLVRAVMVDDMTRFEILAGNRRAAVARKLGLSTVPVRFLHDLSDADASAVAILENLQRADLPPLEEGDALYQLGTLTSATTAEIAARIGKSPVYVARRIALRLLQEPGRTLVRNGTLPLTAAERIAALPPDEQTRLFDVLSRDSWRQWTLRDVVSWIRDRVSHSLDSVRWPKDDATLVPDAGACTTCPHRTCAMPLLFDGADTTANTCLQPACFDRKKTAWLVREAAAWLKHDDGRVLVSEQYGRDPQPIDFGAPVLTSASYSVVKDKTRPGAVKALVVESYRPEDLGKRITVVPITKTTADGQTKPAHGPGSGVTAKERRAQQRDRAVRQALWQAIVQRGDAQRLLDKTPGGNELRLAVANRLTAWLLRTDLKAAGLSVSRERGFTGTLSTTDAFRTILAAALYSDAAHQPPHDKGRTLKRVAELTLGATGAKDVITAAEATVPEPDAAKKTPAPAKTPKTTPKGKGKGKGTK